MSALKLAIPLHGKMATRSFHARQFQDALARLGLRPVYFVGSHYYRNATLDAARYAELDTARYTELIERGARLGIPFKGLAHLRRFTVRTETTELRFRETIESAIFDRRTVAETWKYAKRLDRLRQVGQLGPVAAWAERVLFPTTHHHEKLKTHEVGVVLTPGTWSYGFWHEGLFAREAQRLGIPVVAAITNYDNIINMGFRGFLPKRLAVWSARMADDAIRLQRMPANRIYVTGAVQFDRYCSPVQVSREEFLRSKGLDPSRKTVLYAGGVTISRYFEFYQSLVGANGHGRSPWNVIIRVYPHQKLLSSPGWQVLDGLLRQTPNVYVSNSLTTASDQLFVEDLRRDLQWEENVDELHALLSYSDVMVNHFSTISLEAAICDLPTIHVGYDEYTFGHRFNTTAGFQQRQTHNMRKLRLAAARVIKEEAELIPAIERYLRDRSLERDARRTYAEDECGALDGKASERLAAVLAAQVRPGRS